MGVAVAEALHPAIQLKWPNDLWVEGRKLAGILIETASFEAQGSRRYAVIGVGINIAPRPAEGLSTPPAALQDWLPRTDSAVLIRSLFGPYSWGNGASTSRLQAIATVLDRYERGQIRRYADLVAHQDGM